MNTLTIPDLFAMDDAAFLQVCKDYPTGGMWAYAGAFQYAALRLARVQGLVIAGR